jgi:hypothetical protein
LPRWRVRGVNDMILRVCHEKINARVVVCEMDTVQVSQVPSAQAVRQRARASCVQI